MINTHLKNRDKKIKILIIGPSPTRSKGGMATVINEIRNDKALSEKFEIDIFESFLDGNIFIRFIFSLIAFIRFYFARRNYDIYHIHAASRGSTFRKGFYVDAIKRWQKKIIFHIHGASYLDFYGSLNEKKKSRVRTILKKSNIVIALSSEWKSEFDKTFGLTNCCVLENGVDTESLAHAKTNPIENIKSFAVLGRLGVRKGTYDLLNSMMLVKKNIPDVKLFLAGDGDISKVKELVSTMHLENNVKVLGWIDKSQKIELLKKVSTIILPSYNEGLPMSILEGMACGKAIISTKVGAIPEVVDCNNGILIDAGDINVLANAICTLSSDEVMIKSMSEANIKKIDMGYSMKSMHDKLGSYYLSLSYD